jgi:hypothetical protein
MWRNAMTRLLLLVSLSGFLFVHNATLATAAPPAESIKLPKDVIRMYEYAVGTWQIEGRVGDVRLKGTWTCRWAPGKHFQLISASVKSEGAKKPRKMSAVSGYDPVNKRTIEQIYWSDGSYYRISYDAANPIVDEGTIPGEVSGEEAGKAMKSELQVVRKGPREFLYLSKDAAGDEVEVVFRKVAPSTDEAGIPAEYVAYLEMLDGEWTIDGETDDDSVAGSVTFTLAPNKSHVAWTAKTWQQGKEDEALLGNGIIGWDASNRKLREMAFLSDGSSGIAWLTVTGTRLKGMRRGVNTDGTEWVQPLDSVLDGDSLTFKANSRVDVEGKELARYSGWVFSRKK